MKNILAGSITLIFFILGWHYFVLITQMPDYLLPGPKQTFITLYTERDLILTHAIPTCIETFLGFSLGILLGGFAALLIAFFRPLSKWFLPLFVMSQAIPTFAIAPLLVIWLGYGMASKIATTILMLFFPVTSAFYDGLRNTNTDWLALAATMNAKKWRIFWHIRLPAALPKFASGVRIAAVVAPIGAVVGEWVGSSRGLGYLMLNANARLQIDLMFASLLMMVIMALILYFSVDKLLRTLIWWE